MECTDRYAPMSRRSLPPRREQPNDIYTPLALSRSIAPHQLDRDPTREKVGARAADHRPS